MLNAKKIHLKTIKKHRREVFKACFKMGIPLQGLVHDLSKYSKVEMSMAKYATGKKSPHDIARETLGYSPAWCHHAVRNAHHFEHWLDIGPMKDGHLQIVPVKIPYKYVIEMFCDMLAASKTYNGNRWKPSDLYNWWLKRRKEILMHKDSLYLLDHLIDELHLSGEENFYRQYKKIKKHLKKNYREASM